MGQRLRSYIRQNHLALLALVVAVVGVPTAWAVARNTVGAAQIKKNAVGKSEIKANAVTGSEVNEATLGQVPSAANATNAQSATNAQNATNATNAENATNAGTVGGNTVREVNYSATPVSGPQTILDLGGLQLTADCAAGANTNLVASTTKGDSSVFVSGIDSFNASDIDGGRDIDSGDLQDGDFDVGDALDLDANIGEGNADEEHGFLGYFAPDGSTVTAYLVFDEFSINSCHVNGFAIGG